MSAPRRSISHVSPPHGWGRRRRRTSPRNSSTGVPDIGPEGSRGAGIGAGAGRVRAGAGRAAGVRSRSVAGTRHEVDRDDADGDVREARAELGDRAAGPPERAREDLRLADGGELHGVGQRHAADDDRACRAGRDDARHDAHAADRGRLGAGVAQLVEQQLDGVAGDGTADRDPDPGAGHRQDAGPAEHAVEVGPDLRGRRVAAGDRRGHGLALALQGRDLLAQLVVAGRDVRDELGELRDGQRRQALVGRLRVELGDGEQAQDEQHGGHGELRRPATHQGALRGRVARRGARRRGRVDAAVAQVQRARVGVEVDLVEDGVLDADPERLGRGCGRSRRSRATRAACRTSAPGRSPSRRTAARGTPS